MQTKSSAENGCVGIVGAGQLAYLLCLAGRQLGLKTAVAAVHPDDPAGAAADETFCPAFDDPDVLEAFIVAVDVVTFDMEAVPPAVLAQLEAAEADQRICIRPGTSILRLLQDKGSQKSWLQAMGLPTLPYLSVTGDEPDLAARVRRFGLPCVQKARRGGYDGKGVQRLSRAADLDKLWPVPSVLEPCLTQMTEIAVVIARGTAGETQAYAPVSMSFSPELNVLECVISPAEVDSRIAREAEAIAVRAVEALDGVGIFAIEMFLTPEGKLLINEISPRVHNAGHHTLEAAITSQFTQHLLAITAQPLGQPGPARPAVMQNLLYTAELAALKGRGPGPLPQHTADVQTWWYGKREARQWRKMGHITALADALPAAHQKVAAALGQLGSNSSETST